jgi:hypothetical protein
VKTFAQAPSLEDKGPVFLPFSCLVGSDPYWEILKEDSEDEAVV